MWLNYLPAKWLKSLWGWSTGKNNAQQLEKLKETIPSEPPIIKEPPPPPIRKGSLEDIRDFCDELRKTLRIHKKFAEKFCESSSYYKKTVDDLYVEVGNLRDRIVRFMEGRE